MVKSADDAGRTALAAALARACKRASTAAAVATLVPLAMAATAPQAAANTKLCIGVCVTSSVTSIGSGGFDYNYEFLTADFESLVAVIEIPEVQAGEFLHGSGGFYGSIPGGWSVAENTASAFGSDAPTFKAPNQDVAPGAFIDLTYNFDGGEGSLGSGSSMDITLQSGIGSSVAANAEVGLTGGEGNLSIDPLTPSLTPAPEPGSLAILGSALAGVASLRRRRKT